MKGPIGFGRTVNLVMNIILGLCMTLVILVAVGAPLAPEAIIESWFASFCIGYTFGDLIPIASAGPAICKALKMRNPIGFYVINSIVLGAYFGTIILFGNALINNLPTMGWGAVFGFFMGFWPIAVGAAIVLVIIFLWLAQKIAASVSGFDPVKMPPAQEA
jgi:hypothetical protein